MSDEVEANDEINQEENEKKTEPETITNEEPVEQSDKDVADVSDHPKDDGTNFSINDCFMCKKQLNEPKTLPCLHSFCISCLKDHIEASGEESPKCPVCDSSITDTNVGNLPLDPLIQKVLKCELKDGDVQCSLCDSNATQRCTNCEHFLCSRDAEQHRMIPATKDHEYIEITEYQNLSINDRLALQIVHCSEHTERSVEVYCKLCDDFICAQCNAVAHQKAKHDVEPVADYVKRLTTKLKKVTDEMKKQSELGEKNIHEINQAVDDLKPLKEQASADIKKLCSDLREKIDVCEKELNEELEEKYNQKTTGMERLLTESNINVVQLKYTMAYLDCLIGSQNCELVRHTMSTNLNSFEQTLKTTKQAGKSVNFTEALRVVINEKKLDSVTSENLCCLKLSDVEPENTSFGRVTDVKTGEIKIFTVTTKNEDNKPAIADPIPTIEIVDTDKKVVATANLESHNNGMYQFSWLPKSTGIFGVKVCINKKQIKGSPFKVTVLKGQANKNKTQKKPMANSKKAK